MFEIWNYEMQTAYKNMMMMFKALSWVKVSVQLCSTSPFPKIWCNCLLLEYLQSLLPEIPDFPMLFLKMIFCTKKTFLRCNFVRIITFLSTGPWFGGCLYESVRKKNYFCLFYLSRESLIQTRLKLPAFPGVFWIVKHTGSLNGIICGKIQTPSF